MVRRNGQPASVTRTDPARHEFVVRFGELDLRFMRELAGLLDSLSAIWKPRRA